MSEYDPKAEDLRPRVRAVVDALRKLSEMEDLVMQLREQYDTGNALYAEGTRDAYAEAAELVAEHLLTETERGET